MKVYKIKDKEIYNQLHSILSGFAFFRHTETEYYIKSPKTPVLDEFLKLGLIYLDEKKIKV